MMATHQSLSGGTDDELLQRMVATHPERFGGAFWAFFAKAAASNLPPRPVIIDLGCGPGLFLRDLGERYPAAALYGYDVTPTMIAHAEKLPGAGARLKVALHDLTMQPLPHAAGSVHLVSMSSLLHLFDEPLPVLAEIRRVLAPGGIFLLYDWIRQPLQTYLAWRRETLKEGDAENRRGFRLFPVHNKYTVEDWAWLLTEAGFTIRHLMQFRPTHRIFVTVPTVPPPHHLIS
jgi:SAM-dependent methyltransferase